MLYFDIEEGMLLKAGEEVGVVDTVQLYLKKLQLDPVVSGLPHLLLASLPHDSVRVGRQIFVLW